MADLARLWVLMVTAFVDTLGAFLVLALLPFYAQRFGASEAEVGVLVAAFFFAQTLTAPLWGRASDRFGRRPVLLLGLLLSAVSYVVFAFADSRWLLLLSRLAQGAGGGTISVVFAYISDAVSPERRAQSIGWVTAATSLAAMIGPTLGSFSVRLSTLAPGLITAGLCSLAILFAWWRLPEPGRKGGGGKPTPPLVRSLVDVLARPARPRSALVWIYTTGMLAFNAMMAMAGLFLERRFGVTEETVWVFFAFVAGVSLLVRVTILGAAVERFGEPRVLRFGTLCFAAGLLALPLPGSEAGLAAVVVLIPLGFSLLLPSTTALVSRHCTDPSEVGQVLGVQQAFGGVGRIVGPLLGGAAFERLGAGSPFWLAGGLLLGLLATTAGVRLEAPGAADEAVPETGAPEA